MNDIVLEKRVSKVEKNLDKITDKLDRSIEESHERITRLEDWLIQYTIENKKASDEMRHSMEETRSELRTLAKKHDEGMLEWRASMAESRQKHEEDILELRTLSKKHDEGMLELRTLSKNHDNEFKKWRKELGELSHRLGTMVEDLVAPSLPTILRQVVDCPEEENILVNVRVRRRHPSIKGKMLEIDAVADCGNYAIFNETKSQLSPEKVKDFLEKLAIIRDYFPEYSHHKILGSVASLYVDISLVEYASRQGLIVLAAGEELMNIQNKPGLQWKEF